MAFLAPLFFAALATLAVPIVIHLTQRERKQIVEFPSLMFLEKIPYQSVRRRRIRDWPLLAMRMAAILLIVLAFSRPFFERPMRRAGKRLGAARSRHPARPLVQHGLRRSVGARAGGRAADRAGARSQRPRNPDSVRHERATRGAGHRRSVARDGGHRRRQARAPRRRDTRPG